MNCPSRADPELPAEWNQIPSTLNADTTTRSDLDRVASARMQYGHKTDAESGPSIASTDIRRLRESEATGEGPSCTDGVRKRSITPSVAANSGYRQAMLEVSLGKTPSNERPQNSRLQFLHPLQRTRDIMVKYTKFLGPGIMVAVAFIDPGNYATAVASGAAFEYKLLFVVLLSNIVAIFLQSLCIKMSTVTGRDLAQMNKDHCPPWLNYALFLFGQCAVIATDIAEVIGFAIALNLLSPRIPVVAGCAISILDVMFILLFHRPEGTLLAVRIFEGFVALLVLGVVVCFCYQLSLIENTTAGEVFEGYLPSSVLVESKGLYQACGILGATVMPHSLYLGSGIVKPRLKDYDIKRNHHNVFRDYDDEDNATFEQKYRPSMAAIKACMKYSIIELAVSLFTFALFINSAILIVCGASLYDVNGAEDADLFGIYKLLRDQINHAAATVFAVALLLSGCSAGIVCTLAGQMISEGQLNWKMKPWLTRLLTRSISIVPAILVAGKLGPDGLSAALVGSQVALSVILPFVSAPLIYYTCRNKYMHVVATTSDSATTSVDDVHQSERQVVKMRNNWVVSAIAVLIWVIIVVMNVSNIVLTGLGVN